MPQHRITFEFEQAVVLPGAPAPATAGAKQGWSESWYQMGDLNDSDATAEATVLASNRKAILTKGWALVSMRVSRLDANTNLLRRGRLVFFPPPGSAGYYPGVNQDEQPYDGLILSVQSANGNFRHTGIRGIPQEAVGASGRYLAPGIFASQFSLFRNGLKGTPNQGEPAGLSAYGLRVRSQTADVQITNVLIAGAPVNGFTPTGLQPVLQVSTTGAILSGSTIVISRSGGMANLNGSWIVSGVNIPGGVGAVQLRAKRRVVVSGVAVSMGLAKVYSYSLDAIVGADPEYGSSRRTGRPLQLVRGRRSNRAS